jgi:hypothetical protein
MLHRSKPGDEPAGEQSSPLMEDLAPFLPADVLGSPLESVAFGVLRFLADQDRQGLYDSLSYDNFHQVLRLDPQTHRIRQDLPVGERDAGYAVAEGWALLVARGLLAIAPTTFAGGQSGAANFFVTREGHVIAADPGGESRLVR